MPTLPFSHDLRPAARSAPWRDRYPAVLTWKVRRIWSQPRCTWAACGGVYWQLTAVDAGSGEGVPCAAELNAGQAADRRPAGPVWQSRLVPPARARTVSWRHPAGCWNETPCAWQSWLVRAGATCADPGRCRPGRQRPAARADDGGRGAWRRLGRRRHTRSEVGRPWARPEGLVTGAGAPVTMIRRRPRRRSR